MSCEYSQSGAPDLTNRKQVPPNVRTKYVNIIDAILEGADLTTITRKSILQGIQDQIEYDITPQKSAIKELIGERFDIINARKNGDVTVVPSVEPAEPTPKTNGVHDSPAASASSSPAKREARSETVSDVIDTPPPKKKRKASIDADAAFAARLQAEEDKLARPTRGGVARKAAPVKRKKKPKKEKVVASDDSDIDEDERKAQKPKRETGFHKPLNLSPALSNLFDGETQLSRPETTKRIWAYIKTNGLQDPNDKRFIICDARMREVFRQDKVHMFTMTKLMAQQMYNPDE
ncbi:uncharacterized protein Z518_10291 [Rhinocladiella mackenziei CBS 650.93]|uniref:Rhinocladiella mackenziei CBS 650.93 unplaced genomic scaffold supercont1.9, whole genome shotgun sequence n=1 Tax=Rhinocladiella mackenziei CBS 650.93 TaxID=1442369 RepID=A0A0D2I2Z9_9EURO|nr:uncharacterized protein Z518_10291 [Rhinocladiella mackenziei CBS 650.93]KIX00154.1 hypothetical protein Z518_10291 [Rhinocladiella mackenziei CBS 650.93]